MADKQIHELDSIVNFTFDTLVPVSDGTTTYKAAWNQFPLNLAVRTTADPAAVEGSVRYADYNATTAIGLNPSSLGREGPIWYDGTTYHSLLDARDTGRVVYRRLLSSTASNYTLTAADVKFGVMIHFHGTEAKTVTIPTMAADVVPSGSMPAHGAIGVGRRVYIRQSDTGVITIAGGSGMTLTGTLTTNGTNTYLVVDYLTRTQAIAYRDAS